MFLDYNIFPNLPNEIFNPEDIKGIPNFTQLFASYIRIYFNKASHNYKSNQLPPSIILRETIIY